jgi:hypothetical protein
MSETQPRFGTDTRAAFTGLVLGAVVLLVVLFGIVKLTNNHYAGEKAGAEATH